ncbi:hypothetical protein ACIOJ9_39995 [Streptomyces sp. NPDC088175]
MSWRSLIGGQSASEPEPPQCPPDCGKCRESESIDPDYRPEEGR